MVKAASLIVGISVALLLPNYDNNSAEAVAAEGTHQLVIFQSANAAKIVVTSLGETRTYSSPSVRGLVTFSVFSGSDQPELVAAYNTKLADIQNSFTISDDQLEKYRLVEHASYLWSKQTESAWTSASELLAEALAQLAVDAQGHELVVKFYLETLLELDYYEKFTKALGSAFAQPYRDQFWFQYARVKALDARSEQDTRQRFRDLFQKFKGAQGFTDYQKLEFAEATASYARSIFIEQFYGLDKQDMAYGKGLLDESIKVCRSYDDPACKSHVLNAYSIFYWLEGRYLDGENALKNSLKNARLTQNNRQIAIILNNQAFAFEWQGKVVQALSALTEAYAIEGLLPAQSSTSAIAQNIAKSHLDLGSYELAKNYSEAAWKLSEKLGQKVNASLALLTLSDALLALQNYEAAYNAAESALVILDRFEDAQASNIIKSLNRLAIIELERRGFSKARSYYQRSKVLFDKKDFNDTSFLPKKISRLLEYLHILLALEEHEQFNQVSASLKAIFGGIDTGTDYGIEFQKAEYFKILAQNAFSKSEYQSCVEYAKKSKEYLAVIGSELEYSFKAVNWSRITSEIDSLLLSALMKLNSGLSQDSGQWDQFFSLIFESQSRALRLSRSQVGEFDEQVSEDERLKDIAGLESVAAKTKDQDFRRSLLMQIANLRERYLQIKFKAVQFKENESGSKTDIAQIQSALTEGETVLSFHIKHDVSFVLAISKNDWQLKPLPQQNELQALVGPINDVLLNRGSIGQLRNSGLYRLLKFEELVNNSKNKLYIFSDGPLQNFPFEVLHVGGETYRPLGDFTNIIYIHSIEDYFKHQKPPVLEARPDFFVFADPVFRTENVGKQTVSYADFEEVPRNWAEGLTRLNWTKYEADAILNTFPKHNVTTAIAENALSQSLLSNEAMSAKILHIATHGYFNEQTPHLMGIATTSTTSDSGFVSLTRLYSRKVDSNLVVISACETSVGPVIGNEGSVGLSYGFLSRGAGSVIGTAWKIPDRASALFMAKFYENLLEFSGNSSKALQATKRSFIRSGRYKHPFYWSSFMLFSTSKLVDKDVFDKRDSNLH